MQPFDVWSSCLAIVPQYAVSVSFRPIQWGWSLDAHTSYPTSWQFGMLQDEGFTHDAGLHSMPLLCCSSSQVPGFQCHTGELAPGSSYPTCGGGFLWRHASSSVHVAH